MEGSSDHSVHSLENIILSYHVRISSIISFDDAYVLSEEKLFEVSGSEAVVAFHSWLLYKSRLSRAFTNVIDLISWIISSLGHLVLKKL